ncbi:MAG TPA: radical SAM protein, partial [Desulfuromonadales bacterium]|nr:radical SAM protein [Desulfuromonadales bacterium]
LFISGRCNCDCFYCPTAQNELGQPTTNTVVFRHPADYVAYLERFGFRGASISGGEPLLTPQRTLAFVAAVKRRFGAAMHLWLYTNGTLADVEILTRLRDAGLDEIRFDIGATGYRLEALQGAVGVIPTVTVEIPAIPEDVPLLKERMLQMREAGVDYLNLHQLRLTPYNFDHLVSRGYTFVHGEKVTVMDSELAALELVRHSVDKRLGLPVNYCSFVYKNRYQSWAARRRNASLVQKGYETMTGSGYLRTLTLLGSAQAAGRQAEAFAASGVDGALWAFGSSREKLTFSPALWPLIDFISFRLLVQYAAARQLAAVSYRNPFVNIRLATGKQVTIERSRVGCDFELVGDRIDGFARFVSGSAGPADESFAEMIPFERIAEGLQDYF